MTYKHLSLEEREKLFAFRLQGLSLRQIAKLLGRNQSSLTRELKRNMISKYQYMPCKAQRIMAKRASLQRQKAPLKNSLIYAYVRVHLKEPFFWSPEQISGRLKFEYPDQSINPETIYRYIYAKKAKRYKLWQYLPLKRSTRMKKGGRRIRPYSHILKLISIDQRPKEVNLRQTLGHWETDNLGTMHSDKSALSTTVERVTRFTLLDKMKDGSAESKANVLIKRLSAFPPHARITITADNGKENTNYTHIRDKLQTKVYFCHIYSAWEKGSVENMNARIRRFIPKKTRIDPLSHQQIKLIEHTLNSTPRKCLGYLTPYEKMNELLNSS
jgi:IS30 family transposase